MLQKKLPLLIVLPQAGDTIPPALHAEPREPRPRGAETANRLLRESMDIGDRLECLLAGELSPAVLNLDAPRDDALAETWPDHTPIIALAKKNAKQIKHRLLADYYQTWHRRVSEALAAGRVKTVLDCFVLPASVGRPDRRGTSSGTSVGRPSRPDPHRIILALGNQGDERGEALPHSGPISCPAEWVRDFRDILAARFSDLPGRVGLNTPAPDGHLLRLHARQPVPWIRFGVAPELLNAPEGALHARRPERLRERVEAALVMFCKLQDWI